MNRYVNAMLGLRGTGAKPCLPDPRDHTFAALGLGDGDIDLSSNLEPYIRVVRDQDGVSSCGGQMGAGAMDISTSQSPFKDDYGPASSAFPYYNGRRQWTENVADDGIDMRSLAKAMQKQGVCDEHDWPHSKLTINKRPSWSAYYAALKRAGIKYAFISETGEARVARIATALAAGNPVGMGFRLIKSFADFSGPKIIPCPLNGTVWGLHFMLLVGKTHGLTRVLNSWGPWRDKGLAWFEDEYIGSARWTFDPCVFYGYPRVQK